MIPPFDITSCPNLAVPVQTMQRVAQVESGYNPFAIGVVGARLERQPRNRDEAVATARMLEARGYNFSLGIAQVNRVNLARYGLDSYEKAFDGCANLVAGARILAECYGRARGDWGKALSCYYSGDFVTGYREGYVRRVSAGLAATPVVTVYSNVREHPFGSATDDARKVARGDLSRQAAVRPASTSAPLATHTRSSSPPLEGTQQPGPGSSLPTAAPATPSAFRPHVSGPGGLVATSATTPTPKDSKPPQEASDAAFVF